MYMVIFVLLFTAKQATGDCKMEGKPCAWNVFTHQCGCQNLGITCVPHNILECPNLISLELQDNNITQINATDLLPYTNKLEELILTNNQITSIVSGTFQGMEHLKKLSLVGNNLTSLQDGVFNGLTNLKQLFLSSNRIISIENNVFGVLRELQDLDLSGNLLSGLSNNIFRNLSELRSLDLSYNILTKVPDVFNAMSKLVTLSLRKNIISTLSHGTISELTGLQILYLDSNNISLIENSALANMIHLQKIYLGKNSIRSLNPEIVWADGVETSDLQALILLDIYNNHLTAITKDFMRHLPSIETLNLSGNQIKFIEASSFSGMDNLRYLKLRQNQIQYFDTDVFEDKETISDVTCGKKLKTFSYLQDLDLAENQLQTAPTADIFKMLPSLVFLEMNGNPLHCDCNILPMINWFNSTKHELSSRYYLGKCTTPLNLKDIPITTLNSFTVEGQCTGASIENRKTLILASHGEKVIINCTNSGFPKPDICWDVPEHLNNAGLNISNEHIVIQKVSHQHEGIYICHVKNIFNIDSISYQVRLKELNPVTTMPKTTTISISTEDITGTYQTTPDYNSKTRKLQTFTIIASVLLFVTVVFIIYMVRCHGQQVESCRKHDMEQDMRNNRIARDQRRVYKTLVEERDENIEILNLEQ